MKSFAFGAGAALIAAYTVADMPERVAPTERALTFSGANEAQTGRIAYEFKHRSNRGLPPFWGRTGLTAY